MKNVLVVSLFLFLLSTAVVAQQPSIAVDGVLSAASYLPSGLPNSGIAQGSLFLVFGSNLGPASIAQTGYPLPKTLAGTSIKVTVSGTSVDALMVYSLAGQVAAVLPSSTPVGTGTITVTYNGQTSATAPIKVIANGFGIFALNQGGDGPAVVTTPAFQAVTLTDSAKPGDTLILWGTGLGAYTGDETNPPSVGDLPVNLQLYVGNKTATVLYKGRSSCCAGLDQINFVVPDGVAGCYVPVVVSVNGVISNFTSTSVSPTGGVCSDPAGLPGTIISRVAAGGNLKVGFVELQRIGFSATVPVLGTLNIKQDRGAAYFYNFDNLALVASRGISSISSFSSCTILVCRDTSCIPDDKALTVPRLEAGAALTINGPVGTRQLPRVKPGEYRNTLGGGLPPGGSPNYLEPGAYTVTSPGGADVGAFSANLTIPPPLTWTNQSSVGPIDRTKDLTITWSGGGANDYVAIFGTSTNTQVPVTSTFVCTEKATAGAFTVPSYVLSSLPPSGTMTVSGISAPAGFLLLGNYPLSNTFNAPGLDIGFFTHTVVDGKNTQFR